MFPDIKCDCQNCHLNLDVTSMAYLLQPGQGGGNEIFSKKYKEILGIGMNPSYSSAYWLI